MRGEISTTFGASSPGAPAASRDAASSNAPAKRLSPKPSGSTRNDRLGDAELAAQLAGDGVRFGARRQVPDAHGVDELVALLHRQDLGGIAGVAQLVVERERAVLVVGLAEDHAETPADSRHTFAPLQLGLGGPLGKLFPAPRADPVRPAPP